MNGIEWINEWMNEMKWMSEWNGMNVMNKCNEWM